MILSALSRKCIDTGCNLQEIRHSSKQVPPIVSLQTASWRQVCHRVHGLICDKSY